jgi:hypothetical protein
VSRGDPKRVFSRSTDESPQPEGQGPLLFWPHARIVLQLGIGGGQDLDPDGAIQPRVTGFVDLSEAARTERREDVVWAEAETGSGGNSYLAFSLRSSAARQRFRAGQSRRLVRAEPSSQIGVFRLRLFQHRDVGVGVLPKT